MGINETYLVGDFSNAVIEREVQGNWLTNLLGKKQFVPVDTSSFGDGNIHEEAATNTEGNTARYFFCTYDSIKPTNPDSEYPAIYRPSQERVHSVRYMLTADGKIKETPIAKSLDESNSAKKRDIPEPSIF